ncbi:FUSC family protein [Litorihabitans aurantiacus]|uniref:FUSC family protein n=1 Tax=Litorihabitans aurantiacus TaxID=1930061 RepID=A0AA37XAQ2_9MICO|nr:FUSC family protein [Litorihabitans aurantiacus]GMA30269.1 FUSC family protein [Litorihabitans aurantiacus]
MQQGLQGARTGVLRSRDAAGPIAWVSLASGVAYAGAGALLGHPYPFFAAVAAFSALGFTADVQPRRVGEVAIGISLGVAMGEAIALQFGSGPIQTAVVVFVAAMIAKALDPSPVLTTQSAVQAIVVLGLPLMSSSGGGVGRWTDALIGGAIALVFSLFIPRDPRRRPRTLARGTLEELAEVLARLGRGLHTGDGVAVQTALDRARSTQAKLVAWEASVSASGSTAKLSPAWHRHVAAVADLADACEYTDRAIRTTRVLARRSAVAVREGWSDGEVAGLVEELGIVARRLGGLIGSGRTGDGAAAELAEIAARLGTAGERDPVRHTLLSLLRSATFDLLRAAGQDEAAATRALRQPPGTGA